MRQKPLTTEHENSMNNILAQLKKTKTASAQLALLNHEERKAILLDIAKSLGASSKEISSANAKDISAFKGSEAMRARLEFSSGLAGCIRGVENVANLSDPLGRVLEKRTRPNGLEIEKISVPLGVIGVIYESRPGVTIDLVALAIKSGNAIVLKGGKESYLTNCKIVECMQKILKAHNVSEDAVTLINPKDNWKKELLNAHGLVDLLIPRGGAGLIKFVREKARIPIIETGAGVCHILADESCDVEKAVGIIVNAKVQSPGVCNALDCLVVHEKIAQQLLPAIARALAPYEVEIFADAPSFRIFKNKLPAKLLKKARASDFGHEFLSLKMSIKTVKNFDEGLAFVKKNTSQHTEAILTENEEHARVFMSEIDVAVVIHNASTRFTDGGEFGMGAEVGISTQKLHARGPMGVEALTSYKWIVRGSGQVRVMPKDKGAQTSTCTIE